MLRDKTCRVCCGCQKEFPLTREFFYSDKNSPSGFVSRCKTCMRQQDAQRRQNGVKHNVERTPVNIKRAAKYMRDHKNRRLFQIHQLQLTAKCQLCGYNSCARSLHFHHVTNDKENAISTMLASRSAEAIIAELCRCVVLCANCHGEVHDGLHDNIQWQLLDVDFAKQFINNYTAYELSRGRSGNRTRPSLD